MIATFKSFFSDRYLKIYSDAQPHRLTECFGLTYDRFTKPVNVARHFENALRREDTVLAGSKQQDESTAYTANASIASTASTSTIYTANVPAGDFQVRDWMELLQISTADILCTYVHPAWDGIPAVTRNRYGEGQAIYLGCFFEDDGLEQLLTELYREWDIPANAYHFPVIVRQGINRQGKQITYYMNFSDKEQRIQIQVEGTELFSGEYISGDREIALPPWDVKILET